jgi:hypothetical protein
MRKSLQVMLKDLIHDKDVVADSNQDRRILRIQPIEVLANHVIEVAIGPLFVANKL